MRIPDRSIYPAATEAARTSTVNRPRAPLVPAASAAGDLVCLSAGVSALTAPAGGPSREALVANLKAAYESGAIRPDPERLAASLLRWSSEPLGGRSE